VHGRTGHDPAAAAPRRVTPTRPPRQVLQLVPESATGRRRPLTPSQAGALASPGAVWALWAPDAPDVEVVPGVVLRGATRGAKVEFGAAGVPGAAPEEPPLWLVNGTLDLGTPVRAAAEQRGGSTRGELRGSADRPLDVRSALLGLGCEGAACGILLTQTELGRRLAAFGLGKLSVRDAVLSGGFWGAPTPRAALEARGVPSVFEDGAECALLVSGPRSAVVLAFPPEWGAAHGASALRALLEGVTGRAFPLALDRAPLGSIVLVLSATGGDPAALPGLAGVAPRVPAGVTVRASVVVGRAQRAAPGEGAGGGAGDGDSLGQVLGRMLGHAAGLAALQGELGAPGEAVELRGHVPDLQLAPGCFILAPRARLSAAPGEKGAAALVFAGAVSLPVTAGEALQLKGEARAEWGDPARAEPAALRVQAETRTHSLLPALPPTLHTAAPRKTPSIPRMIV